MSKEEQRLGEINNKKKNWRKWGPYLSDREWGTVREDYSPNGDAWNYFTYDDARSRTYRWGEDGIGGICDEQQILCFAFSFWNGKDPFIKERYFGLTNPEGNHGEDVKEYYYYLENLPTHSYMKMLYKYPQSEFPYKKLIDENAKRSRKKPEFELIDTGIFDEGKYFDIFIEYAKADAEDILIKAEIFNRSDKDTELNFIPQLWFRNTWAWGYNDYNPILKKSKNSFIKIEHKTLDRLNLYYEGNPEVIFCENDTNYKKLFNVENKTEFCKDGINEFIINKNEDAVNNRQGTKAGLNYKLKINAGKSETIKLRLAKNSEKKAFDNFDKIFNEKLKETDEFYSSFQKRIKKEELKNIQRQAFAGILWNKQFYYFDIAQWLNGDPAQPTPPPERKTGTNSGWVHLNNFDVISMPDKWEYPWYASWDLGFHCVTLSLIDAEFAKHQLIHLTREWYMHPNGQLPAYEWNFSAVNPPVHAYAAWRVYKIDEKNRNGKGDIKFLESVFHKLLLNFTWWVNRKDTENKNIFQGGFLGLDNIGVFDRNNQISGAKIEQADGTAWMAMYCLNMMRISLELSKENKIYQDLATKFFEHFLYIAGAMFNIGEEKIDMWDEEDEFYYDVLHTSDGKHQKLKVRSIVGLIPLFAVEVLEPEVMKNCPDFAARLEWFLDYRKDLAGVVSHWEIKGKGERRLLSLLRGHRMKCLLRRMLDEQEFLSEFGVRALSRYHLAEPYIFKNNGEIFKVGYVPGESDSAMFGGNSNWRGPVWFPVNFMLIESLQRFHHYYGDDFKVEHPTGTGNFLTLREISDKLSEKLLKIFLPDDQGNRPINGNIEKFNKDKHFKNYILFHEYFHGDNGTGLGASHQTGWTGLIAKLMIPERK
ncbi:MAG: glucosidase [Ignavibacteriaceae bacterium]